MDGFIDKIYQIDPKDQMILLDASEIPRPTQQPPVWDGAINRSEELTHPFELTPGSLWQVPPPATRNPVEF